MLFAPIEPTDERPAPPHVDEIVAAIKARNFNYLFYMEMAMIARQPVMPLAEWGQKPNTAHSAINFGKAMSFDLR